MVRHEIVFVTSAQPSANPRLLKEAKSLQHTGYLVSVIWCPISPWADKFDQQLFNEFPSIKWIKAGYHAKTEPIGYWYARIRQKIWLFIYKLIGNHFDAAIKSLVLYSQELTYLALQQKAVLYIGHNLGALPALFIASKKYKAKSIFDFEDYHRGESYENSLETKRVIDVENNYIPLVSSITTASSSISNAYKKIFPDKLITTINNCFSLKYATESVIKIPQSPLKLFWFSQYIGKKRGLENIIQAMSFFPSNDIKLTLLGTSTNEIQNYLYDIIDNYNLSREQIIFLSPVSEKKIVQIASEHHIGLASEYSHNTNRDLCLTNKIFTYLLAGNALILSDTYAQKSFLSENPGIGSLYEQNSVKELTSVLKSYLGDSELLMFHRQNALELAKVKYNWDIEQHQFIYIVKSVLAS